MVVHQPQHVGLASDLGMRFCPVVRCSDEGEKCNQVLQIRLANCGTYCVSRVWLGKRSKEDNRQSVAKVVFQWRRRPRPIKGRVVDLHPRSLLQGRTTLATPRE